MAKITPLTPASDRLGLAAALETVASGGSTDLHGGWLAGAEALADVLPGEGVHRVILLSDGCANRGETDLETIAGQCKALARRGVSTSTYGLGHGFNESLMLAMASAGRGNAYYGQTAADLAEPFATEFSLLTSLCARGLVLKVNAPPGVRVTLRNDYEPVEGEATSWRLPDLAFAAEAWALVELELPAASAPERAPSALPITFSIGAATQDSAPLFLMAGLPAMPIVDTAAWDAMPHDELVARRMLELDAADSLQALRVAIDAGDWPLAERLLHAARARFAGHPWASAILMTMQRLIEQRDKRLAAKEAAFANRSMKGRLSQLNEPMFCMDDTADVPAFLRRKPEQGKGEPRQ